MNIKFIITSIGVIPHTICAQLTWLLVPPLARVDKCCKFPFKESKSPFNCAHCHLFVWQDQIVIKRKKIAKRNVKIPPLVAEKITFKIECPHPRFL